MLGSNKIHYTPEQKLNIDNKTLISHFDRANNSSQQQKRSTDSITSKYINKSSEHYIHKNYSATSNMNNNYLTKDNFISNRENTIKNKIEANLRTNNSKCVYIEPNFIDSLKFSQYNIDLSQNKKLSYEAMNNKPNFNRAMSHTNNLEIFHSKLPNSLANSAVTEKRSSSVKYDSSNEKANDKFYRKCITKHTETNSIADLKHSKLKDSGFLGKEVKDFGFIKNRMVRNTSGILNSGKQLNSLLQDKNNLTVSTHNFLTNSPQNFDKDQGKYNFKRNMSSYLKFDSRKEHKAYDNKDLYYIRNDYPKKNERNSQVRNSQIRNSQTKMRLRSPKPDSNGTHSPFDSKFSPVLPDKSKIFKHNNANNITVSDTIFTKDDHHQIFKKFITRSPNDSKNELLTTNSDEEDENKLDKYKVQELSKQLHTKEAECSHISSQKNYLVEKIKLLQNDRNNLKELLLEANYQKNIQCDYLAQKDNELKMNINSLDNQKKEALEMSNKVIKLVDNLKKVLSENKELMSQNKTNEKLADNFQNLNNELNTTINDLLKKEKNYKKLLENREARISELKQYSNNKKDQILNNEFYIKDFQEVVKSNENLKKICEKKDMEILGLSEQCGYLEKEITQKHSESEMARKESKPGFATGSFFKGGSFSAQINIIDEQQNPENCESEIKNLVTEKSVEVEYKFPPKNMDEEFDSLKHYDFEQENLNGLLTKSNTNLEMVQQENNALLTKTGRYHSKIEQLNNQNLTLKQKFSNVINDNNTLIISQNEIKRQSEDSDKAIKISNEENIKLKSQIKVCIAQIRLKSAELHQMKNQNDKKNKEIEGLESTVNELKNHLEESFLKVKSFKNEIDDLKQYNGDLESNQIEIDSKNENLENELKEKNNRITFLKSLVDALESDIEYYKTIQKQELNSPRYLYKNTEKPFDKIRDNKIFEISKNIHEDITQENFSKDIKKKVDFSKSIETKKLFNDFEKEINLYKLAKKTKTQNNQLKLHDTKAYKNNRDSESPKKQDASQNSTKRNF